MSPSLQTAITELSSRENLDAVLTDFHRNTPESIVAGRNIVAGYVRGGGLDFGKLDEIIEKDPIYQESFQLASDRTFLTDKKLKNIFLIMKYGMKNLSGDIIECGCYRGGSALFLANVARRFGMTGTIYTLDTFKGIPEADIMLDFHAPGDFSDTNFYDFMNEVTKSGLDNLISIQGRFEETLPQLLCKIKPIALAHIDCVAYSAVTHAFTTMQPYLHPAGAYLIFDDPLQGSCLGAFQAIEEMVQAHDLHAEQAYPHLLYRFPKVTSV